MTRANADGASGQAGKPDLPRVSPCQNVSYNLLLPFITDRTSGQSPKELP
jgi:hypothetical protein